MTKIENFQHHQILYFITGNWHIKWVVNLQSPHMNANKICHLYTEQRADARFLPGAVITDMY